MTSGNKRNDKPDVTDTKLHWARLKQLYRARQASRDTPAVSDAPDTASYKSLVVHYVSKRQVQYYLRLRINNNPFTRHDCNSILIRKYYNGKFGFLKDTHTHTAGLNHK